MLLDTIDRLLVLLGTFAYQLSYLVQLSMIVLLATIDRLSVLLVTIYMLIVILVTICIPN